LRDAFASMLGTPKEAKRRPPAAELAAGELEMAVSEKLPCAVAKSMRERLLKRCCSLGGPIWAAIGAELAAAMRGVSPSEIEAAVGELNSIYGADGAPYCIEQNKGGYRLVLRDEFQRMRDKFYGRVKEARLSPAVLEVLSVLAYNQPATAEHLSEVRGAPCGAALSTLVRRRLVKLDRAGDGGKSPAVFDDRSVLEALWAG